MPIRIPVFAVQVVRDGKLIRPEIGKEFDFTAEELKDIKNLLPSAVRTRDEEPPLASKEAATGQLVVDQSGTTRDQVAAAKDDGKKADSSKGSKAADKDL